MGEQDETSLARLWINRVFGVGAIALISTACLFVASTWNGKTYGSRDQSFAEAILRTETDRGRREVAIEILRRNAEEAIAVLDSVADIRADLALQQLYDQLREALKR